MQIRAELLLPIFFLACGCCAVPSLPGIPGPGPSLVMSVPAGSHLSAVPSVNSYQSADLSLKRYALPVAHSDGLVELVKAQRLAGRGATNAGTLRLSRSRLMAEMDNVLKAVHTRSYDQVPAALGMARTDAPQLEDFFRNYFEAYFRKFHVINTGGEEAGFFYNRACQKFGFPTITVSVNAPQAGRLFEVTRIDEIAVIGDLTRVAIEALADWMTPHVPADENSTGCVTGLLKKPACRPAADTDLRCIVKIADTTEAISGYAAAHVVRGGWWVALNNEALAKSVQVIFSVSARKMAEDGAAAVDLAKLCPKEGNPAPLATTTLKVDLVR
jgi:hypothetical protein